MLIFGADDPYFRQHRGMGERTVDVLPPQSPVEADRGVDVLHYRRGTAREAAPHCGLAARSSEFSFTETVSCA